MKSSLLSTDGQILEKNDQTPVTVADFGVQALVSLGNKNFVLYSIGTFRVSVNADDAIVLLLPT